MMIEKRKAGGLKALVIGPEPMDEEAPASGEMEGPDHEALTAVGEDMLAAIAAKDAAAIGRAFADGHAICADYGNDKGMGEETGAEER